MRCGKSDLMVVMRTSRGAAVAALASVGLILAGCGGGGDAAPTSEAPKPSALASLDPCTVLSPQELQSIGVQPQGKPVDQGIGEPGCRFTGGPVRFTVYKAEKSDRAYWEGQRGQMGVFEPNQVGAHEGIKAIPKGSVGHGLCRQIMLADTGSVSVDANTNSSAGADPCSDALKIAQQIEPKLPK